MLSRQSVILIVLATLLAACSANPSNWWKGDPNYVVPPLINNG
jgi:hypothetical protein